MTDVDLMLHFLVQIILILSACKVVGWFGSKFLGQTQVVMEMVTGVILGPSCFGAFFPELQKYVFPSGVIGKFNGAEVKHPSMTVLYVIAQIGLVLYMFTVGLEFNIGLISKRVKGVISVSLAGIILPFGLGAALAYFLLSSGRTDLFASSVTIPEAALYMGAAMCITAFPMLARILVERGIAQTTMGTLALGAGATDDVTAWALLAVVLASYKHDSKFALYAIGGGILFGIIVFTLGKKLMSGLAAKVDLGEPLSQGTFLTAMLFLFTGAYITDAIGVYAVFGAFMVGAAMPRGKLVAALRNKIEPLTVGCFLPFFFVYSGLSTKFGLLNTPTLWGICGLACAAAMIGKFGGCTLAAKMSGESWRSASAIGTLMNSRGLMELIILNIGRQQHVISDTLFTMLVIMAIVTTLMASPLFRAILGSDPEKTVRELEDLPNSVISVGLA